ncbi:hypothetical protein NP233_g10770 [Leucocoprinus birnbaumii]|uniref:Retrovirus-related Pol polyprotein from transposon TNT 1-94-like beta-barrel domain-containing protein n=1 Tax=Leucocoprinus birnbaumii TaxID=56174 RepID=A0AAD5VK43_9AGAR|nr:hypothetical protein NP233_g10770 [Leucocoprinus birnbaumii]
MQREPIIDSQQSQDMWDHLHMNYFQQRSGINVHYLYQQLYSQKWDGNLPISDYISFYLNICRQFIEAGHRADNVTIINALLLSLPHTSTWEVVKQNLLYKGVDLTIEKVSTKLVSVHDCIMLEDKANGVSKKMKTLVLVSTQSNSTSKKPGKGGSKQGGRKKNLSIEEKKERAKKYTKPDDVCKKCGRKGHWEIVCCGEFTRNSETAHLTVDDLASTESQEAGRVYMMMTHRYDDHSKILLDSAASCHMFSNRDLFLSYEKVKNNHISTGGSYRITVEALCDVNFNENDTPSKLASIDLPRATTEEVDKFVDDAIDNETSSEDEPESAEALEQRPVTPPNTVSPPSKPPPAPRKTTQWSTLPKCDLSSCTQKPVQRYGQQDSAHVAFLTIGGGPSNYKGMMNSPDREGWKAAVDTKYCQLEKQGVSEWVENLPEGKKVVGSCTVYCDKLGGHSNHVKFKS